MIVAICKKEIKIGDGDATFIYGKVYDFEHDHNSELGSFEGKSEQSKLHVFSETFFKEHFEEIEGDVKGGGTRDNKGKLRWSLFPFSVFEGWNHKKLRGFSDKIYTREGIEDSLQNILEGGTNPLELLLQTLSLYVNKDVDYLHTIQLPLEDCIRVLEFGCKKYSAHNWKKGLKVTESLDSFTRHFRAYCSGEELDPESGLPHIGHMLCNAMFATWMVQNKPEFDDRYKSL